MTSRIDVWIGDLRGSSLAARAAAILAVGVWGVATMRIVELSGPGTPHVHSRIAAVVASPLVQGCAAGIEATVGVMLLLRPARRTGVAAALAWSSILAGVAAALIVLGVPLSECGCVGSRVIPTSAKVSFLAGAFCLGCVALEPQRRRSAGLDHELQ